jgi:putative DNA primase/helicase
MSLKIKRPNNKNFETPFTKDYTSQFKDFLATNGYEPDPNKGLVTDGSIGRAYINIGNQRKLVGWYQAWLDQSLPYGRIGDYRVSTDQPTATWKPENSKKYRMTKEQKAEIEELRRAAEVKTAEKYTQAAERSQSIWAGCEDVVKHEYLENKQVLSYGLKKDKHDNLVIPLKDKQGTIVGLQFIAGDGSKRFLTGSKKSGSFFLLGREIFNSTDTLNYAEGYATAASIYADRSQPVVVAFDAYNLSPVAEVMYEYFPKHKHVFVADNDDSKTGEKEAMKAAAYINKKGGYAEVQMPETKGDYNDHKNEVAVVEGEVVLQTLDVPVEFDFVRSASGRFLNTKDNIGGVLKAHSVDVRYNVIKKKMEIDIPQMKFIADMHEEASLIEIEDRCINMGIPHTKVRDYLKVLAREYNPSKRMDRLGPLGWPRQTPRLFKFADYRGIRAA